MIDFGRPGLAVFDMDSTLISIECIDQLAALHGCYDAVASVTAAAMAGQLDFAESLRRRVALLAGLPSASMARLFEPIPLNPGAAELVAWLHQKGWRVAVVSGGFTWFTERLAQHLGLDAAVANTLLWQQEQLTGLVAEPIIDAQGKAQHLQALARHWQIPLSNTLAVGDGANDIPLLQTAGYGIAYRAKAALREHADWCSDDENLMAIAKHFDGKD